MTDDILAAVNAGPTEWPVFSFALTLVLARVAAATILLPGIGETAAPSIIRAGVAFCLSILIVPSVVPLVPAAPEAGIQAGLAIVAEVMTGLAFGWLARLWSQALVVSAQFVAYLLGISSVLQPDAELGPQSTALAKLFDLAAPLLVLSSGLYTLPIRALVTSYRLIPPGKFPFVDAFAEMGVNALAATFALSLQLASPFVIASIVWHLAIGLMSRLVPRMQIYFISTPGQILGGTVLLSATAAALLTGWYEAVRAGFALSLPR